MPQAVVRANRRGGNGRGKQIRMLEALESGDTHVSHWYLEATGMTPSFTASRCISGRPTKNTLPDPGLQSDFTKGGYSSLALFLTVPQPPNLAPEQSLWDLSEWLQSTLFN